METTPPALGVRSVWRGACVIAVMMGYLGCPEWLEIDDGTEEPAPVATVEETEPVFLPTTYPSVAAKGPLVPGSPGLRVPEGYFARARLDVADIHMPWAYAAFLRSDGELVLRIVAVSGPYVVGGPFDGTAPIPTLRAVIHLSLPDATEIRDLVGTDFGPEALKRATVTLRVSQKFRYLVTLSRLSIQAVGDRAVSGSLEGVARRGKRATPLPVKVGFVALKATPGFQREAARN